MARFLICMVLTLVACTPDLPQQVPPPQIRSNDASVADPHQGVKAIGAALARHKPESRVLVTATPAGDASNPKLLFAFTNISSKPITIYPTQLPWGNPNSVEVALLTVPGKIHPTSSPIADPGGGEPIVVSPGETLRGEFDLHWRLHDASAAIAREDVLVLWTYEFRDNDQDGVASGIVRFGRHQ